MSESSAQTTVRRSWPLSDADEVETIKTALERLEIPYVLSFDTKRGNYNFWEFTITLTGDVVDVPPFVEEPPE